MKTSIANVFSVDVEDWHHANFPSLAGKPRPHFPSILDDSLEEILSLCAATGVKGTFFVLGEVAEKRPELVRRVAAQGHEIASHGHSHRLVHELGRGRFRDDLARSVHLLEDITGRKVVGFRAPSWSLDADTQWVYEELARLGLRYDASVMPFRTFLYGIDGAPRTRFKSASGVWEFPASTYPLLGKNIPFAGGFFLRLLPRWMIAAAMTSLNRRQERCVVYIHPRELASRQPRLSLDLRDRFVFYWGTWSVGGKLRSLLNQFQFTSFEEVLRDLERDEAICASHS